MSKLFQSIAVAVLVAVSSNAAEPRPVPPNIVFILADDLGINDLGCYGRKDQRTPNLGKLATEGARFTSAYAACPVCSPTRAALMTGLAPARLHLTTFLPGRKDLPSQKLLHPVINQHLPDHTKTIADYLRAGGYATACFGKWHLGAKGHQPTDHGFDSYYPGRANTQPTQTEGGKGEYDLTKTAIQFMEANKAKPFFLYLAHNTPHIPFKAKTEVVTKNSEAFEPVYAAVIESMDDTVGMVLEKVDELDLRANTVVIFTSDNGGLHVPEGSHKKITHNTPFRAGKGFLYEGGIRVPLLVRWPGKIPAKQMIDTPVITTDWLPTLMEMTGNKAPAELDGVSIAGLLTGSAKPAERSLFWHLPHYTNQGSRPSGAVREGDWKFIEHYEDGSVELFNLAVDISEQMNLADKEKEKTGRLRAQLADWLKRVDAQINAVNPDFKPALHRQLYVDVDPSAYDPKTAGSGALEVMLGWRKRMDAVTPK